MNTAWTLQIIRGIILSGVLFITAGLTAAFFSEPRAIPLIKTLALTELVKGLINPGVFLLRKNLEFHKQFIFDIVSTLVDFFTAIFLAITLKSVWALIIGLLARNLTQLLMSFILSPHRPSLEIDSKKSGRLLNFGKWIFSSSILNFANNEGDDILVGKILGTATLGLYQMAYKISNIPATEITHVISKVTFPAYTFLQDNIQKLREAYQKVVFSTIILSFPISAMVLLFARDFVLLFLGSQWSAMIPAMQILSFWGLLRSIGACTGPVFKSTDNANLMVRSQLVRLIILAAVVYPLTLRWGINGTSFAILLSALLTRPLTDYYTLRIIQLRYLKYLSVLFAPGLSTSIMIISIIALRNFYLEEISLINFLVSTLLAGTIYLISLIIGDHLGQRRLNSLFSKLKLPRLS